MVKRNIPTLFEETLASETLSEKQKAVLQASLTLFSKKGFDRTSTRDIATLAQVSEGTVYKQFKTKDALLVAILTPVIQSVIPKLADEFFQEITEKHDVSLEDFLYWVLKDRADFVLQNRLQVRILLQELTHNPALLQQLQKVADPIVHTKAQVIIEQYQQEGKLVQWPIERILHYIVGVFISYLIPSVLISESPLDTEKIAHQAAVFLSKGLQP